MTTTRCGSAETARRAALAELLGEIEPWDEREAGDLGTALQWIASGLPLYRIRKPDVPPMHLVSYFVVLDAARRELLLVAHQKAGLWLPTGGHVEPAEDPWDTVARECREELHISAVPSPVGGRRPFFLTITRTRGEGRHTDVTLWYLLQAERLGVTSYDEEEFAGIRWLTLDEVVAEPADKLDPEMHRFTRKLMTAIGPSTE